MRLHIHHQVGSGDGLCGFDQETKEPITVTHAEIIYRRRIAVLDYAARVGNVAETCRVFGISRTRYYEWKNRADLYGLDALMPKERRCPQMPSATPTHVVERLLTLAVLEPTIGCRQYADRLGDQGFAIAKSTVRKAPGRPWAGHEGKAPGQSGRGGGSHDGPDHRGGPGQRALSGSAWPAAVPGELVCVDQLLYRQAQGRGARCTSSAPSTSSPAGPSSGSWWAPPTPLVSVRFLERLLRHYRQRMKRAGRGLRQRS